MATYQIQGYQTTDTDNGYDAERFAPTIKLARKTAQYMLSDDYRRVCEAAQPLVKIQIWKDKTLIDEI